MNELTKEQVVALATAIGLKPHWDGACMLEGEDDFITIYSLRELANAAYRLGVESEREACAKLCDAEAEANCGDSGVVADNLAYEIRRRGTRG